MLKGVSCALLGLFILLTFRANAQSVSGTIRDGKTNEPVIGAIVQIKDGKGGAATDLDGRFEISPAPALPFTLLITYVGYENLETEVTSLDKPITLKLRAKEVELKGVEVTGSRISEKQKQAPLTVESMDIIAIKDCPQPSFYQALGTLKGVDMTTASLGFTVINTRGFNSTSPVRSLQLIDGVDNQSPGLNFSLGNFLGAPELDVLKVDLIAGASTAFYGPNAFNGVISITSRSPFIKPGLEVSVKAGERNLLEASVRWAQVFKNKEGKEKFGYKLNLFAMKANDWEAENADPTEQSRDGVTNPGGYDAVNRYGDEYNSAMDLTGAITLYPGGGRFYRSGYWERDLVDYNSRNLKTNVAFHYKIKDSVEVILASSFGTGTTVYQGDNRYSLKDILFFQNRIEIRKPDKYFLRLYATNEDAGKSYDAYFTALLLQRTAKSDPDWANDYYTKYRSFRSRIITYPGYPQPSQYPRYEDYVAAINPFLLENYYDSLVTYHNISRAYADGVGSSNLNDPFLAPGTMAFDTAFAGITSRKSYSEGGSRFYDKSALYHAQGEYKFIPAFMDITLGGNFRLYRPSSDGTIFSDTAGRRITNQEFGVYTGFEKGFGEKLKLNLTARFDKNENFDALFSPALSAVYTMKPNQILRVSFSSAIRNPTLADQFLYYNVGRAVLLGNTKGYDSLVTVPSLLDYFINQTPLEYFNLDPVKPEKVRTVELGYRGTIGKNLFVDLVGYYSSYTDFIGYQVGADVTVIPSASLIYINNIYRIAANASESVSTYGTSIGLSYFLGKFLTINGNYSFNRLEKSSSDPLIPAYNTPENKYNIGISGRDIEAEVLGLRLRNYGFSINYKWVEGFRFEGSPQFTGYVPQYDFVDAQISKRVPKIHATFKVGASNVLNQRRFTVYGGPETGRLAYASILVELQKN